MNASQANVPPGAEERPDHKRPLIVVGIDGSDSSQEALRAAIRLAEPLNSSVEAITAWSQPIAATGYSISPQPDWSEDARDTVETTADVVFGKNRPEWFSTAVREGNPARVLISESAGTEMLVVGSRGHGGFAGLLLGSVSAECAEHARCPVLVVH